jgi:hypothetical protein
MFCNSAYIRIGFCVLILKMFELVDELNTHRLLKEDLVLFAN